MNDFFYKHGGWMAPVVGLIVGIALASWISSTETKSRNQALADAKRECTMLLAVAPTPADSLDIMRGRDNCSYYLTATPR